MSNNLWKLIKVNETDQQMVLNGIKKSKKRGKSYEECFNKAAGCSFSDCRPVF